MASSLVIFFLSKKIIAWEVFIFEGTPSFLKKYQKGTPRFLIAVPQPQVILERQKVHFNVNFFYMNIDNFVECKLGIMTSSKQMW